MRGTEGSGGGFWESHGIWRRGMNREPDRLYSLTVVVLCSCQLRARGERSCGRPFRDLKKSRREPARVPHRPGPHPVLQGATCHREPSSGFNAEMSSCTTRRSTLRISQPGSEPDDGVRGDPEPSGAAGHRSARRLRQGRQGPPHCTTESRGHDMAGDATVIAVPAGLRSAARPRTQPVRE